MLNRLVYTAIMVLFRTEEENTQVPKQRITPSNNITLLELQKKEQLESDSILGCIFYNKINYILLLCRTKFRLLI